MKDFTDRETEIIKVAFAIFGGYVGMGEAFIMMGKIDADGVGLFQRDRQRFVEMLAVILGVPVDELDANLRGQDELGKKIAREVMDSINPERN